MELSNAQRLDVIPNRPAPRHLSARQAAAEIVLGSLTSVELVTSCLERIESREAEVQAWDYLDLEGALAVAHERDRAPAKGPLHGVPVGIKDIIDTSDMPTLLADPEIYAGRRPPKDAELVYNLRKSGAVILGKTAPSRHGVMVPGKTRNPWDLTRSPGASSSGSAAAVADYMVPLAVGSQTAGSILRPAAYCGVVGFKPSIGTVSTKGVREYSKVLDTIGPLARSVSDAKLLLEGMTLTDWSKTEPPADKINILVQRRENNPRAEGYIEDRYQRVVQQLHLAGVSLRDFGTPDCLTSMKEAQYVVMAYDIARSFAPHITKTPDLIAPDLLALCDEGTHIRESIYSDALNEASVCATKLAELMGDGHALLTPSTSTDAPPLSSTGTSEFLAMWTLLGFPSIHLPTGTSPCGRPIGVQLVGKPEEDRQFMSVSAVVESSLMNNCF